MSQRLRTLWEDLFAGSVHHRSMRTVASALRAQRRRRLAQQWTLCAAMMGSLLVGWWLWRGPKERPDELGTGVPVVELAQQPGNAKPAISAQETEPVVAVKYLSDTEMLEQLKGYPVALVGQPGNRRLVYLGESPEARAVFTQAVSTPVPRQCPLATRADFALLDCAGCHR
jgi:hypothetical protein